MSGRSEEREDDGDCMGSADDELPHGTPMVSVCAETEEYSRGPKKWKGAGDSINMGYMAAFVHDMACRF